MKALYKFHFDCGRAGELHGIFIADPAEVAQLVDSLDDIYFGEVLGKHSDIKGPLERQDFTLITDDPDLVEKMYELGICVGFNPVACWREQKEANVD